MGEILLAVIGGSCGAAIVSGVFGVIMWRLNRKAQKEDKREEILKQLECISNKLDEHIEQDLEDKMSASRIRILRFFDDEVAGIPHSKEHWLIMIETIDEYEDYCNNHPDYPNCKADIAIGYIKEKFAEKLKHNSF